METITNGELVTVTADGPVLNGIVFDVPSASKVVVAVIDRARGPVLRTVHPDALEARENAASEDRALKQLIRRTPSPVRGSTRGRSAGGHGRAGHTRGASHRATGR